MEQAEIFVMRIEQVCRNLPSPLQDLIMKYASPSPKEVIRDDWALHTLLSARDLNIELVRKRIGKIETRFHRELEFSLRPVLNTNPDIETLMGEALFHKHNFAVGLLNGLIREFRLQIEKSRLWKGVWMAEMREYVARKRREHCCVECDWEPTDKRLDEIRWQYNHLVEVQ